jgi:hypothetical protein
MFVPIVHLETAIFVYIYQLSRYKGRYIGACFLLCASQPEGDLAEFWKRAAMDAGDAQKVRPGAEKLVCEPLDLRGVQRSGVISEPYHISRWRQAR